jgi:exodeoxyribonuclease V gamma subunit
MLKLTYSNNLERLIIGLIQNSDALTKGGTLIFSNPPTIIVPNRNIQTWLSFEIAHRTGIAANIQFLYLEAFVQSLLTDHEQFGVIVDRAILQSALISFFLKTSSRADCPNIPKDVAAYLFCTDNDDERDLRIYQLSGQLSRIFEEYSLSRNDMLAKWRLDQQVIHQAPYASIERWQKSLWLMLLGENGLLFGATDSQGRPLITYEEALERLMKQPVVFPGELHFFGFSYMSHAYVKAIAELSRRQDIYYYALNPCREFWEDVHSPSEELRQKERLLQYSKRLTESYIEESDDFLSLYDVTETPALRLWGRPGREHMHLLNLITDCNFTEAFDDPLHYGDTLLHRLQHDILFRNPLAVESHEIMDYRDDKSINIIACPGIQREVEIVANEIWSLMLQQSGHDALRFNEIAVIIADTANYDIYRTHITSVFREIHNIPHSMTDAVMTKESSIVDAIQLLLELPLSSFRREDVLRVITHPAIIARCPDVNPDEWIAWAERIGIFHGHHREAHSGTYIKKDLYNWDQGLRRLALGAFMCGTRSDSEMLFSVDDSVDAYLPEEFGLSSMPNAARAIALVRSLIADCRFALQQKMTLEQWAVFLQKFIMSYIAAETDSDDHVMSRCLAVVDLMKQRQIDDTKISYRIACEFVQTALSELTGDKGLYLARGVAVSSFLPMRPIPFRTVFILGLGEGKFPCRDMRNPLDLRGVRRMPGDVTARERDQYMFLETLISTRDRLYLTYVSRDSQTGEILEPSSAVKELQFLLERGYVSADGMKKMFITHPLRRFAPEYFPELFGSDTKGLPNFSPEARREAEVAAMHQALLAECGGTLPDRALIDTYMPEHMQHMLGLYDLKRRSFCDNESLVEISLYALRRFLECPLQGWAEFRLQLREEAFDNILLNNNEAFEVPYRDAINLQRKTFVKSWNSTSEKSMFAETAHSVYDKLIRLTELNGRTPSGFFLQSSKQKHMQLIETWYRHLTSCDNSPSRIVQVMFGQGYKQDTIDHAVTAVTLSLSDLVKAEISGNSGLLSDKYDSAFVLFSKKASDFSYKYFLQPFLDLMCLVMVGFELNETFPVTLVCKDRLITAAFRVPDQKLCYEYLKNLVKDLTENAHDYFLPIEAVMSWKYGNEHRALESCIAELLENSWKINSCLYGPIETGDFSFLQNHDAGSLAEKRFGLFFETFIPCD